MWSALLGVQTQILSMDPYTTLLTFLWIAEQSRSQPNGAHHSAERIYPLNFSEWWGFPVSDHHWSKLLTCPKCFQMFVTFEMLSYWLDNACPTSIPTVHCATAFQYGNWTCLTFDSRKICYPYRNTTRGDVCAEKKGNRGILENDSKNILHCSTGQPLL